MINRILKIFAFIIIVCGFSELPLKAQDSQRPNILLIMADDLGYSVLGSYGGEIDTPNLDKLAKDGLRFTQMYNYARCSPSRASLLTGLYPHQAGIGFFAGDRPNNPRGYRGKLQPSAVTLAEVLKESGYRTFMTGKWHVSDPVPTKQGFEEFYGFTQGYAINSWNPDMNIRLPDGHSRLDFNKDEYFATDAYTDYAIKFIKQAQKETPDKPWFTYVSYQAPHFPLQAPQKYIEKYEGKYDVGWDQLREERLVRMKKLGLIAEDTKLSPRSSIPRPKVAERHGVQGDLSKNPAWESIPEDRKKDLTRRMAVYAGMIDNMDHNIGRIINYLEQKGTLDNTIVIFVSDNGGCAEWGPYGFDLNKKQLATQKAGVGVKGWTPGLPSKFYAGSDLEKMGGPGTGIAYGSGWANLSNTPWSEYKHYTYEGGIATPMIVHWPNRISGEMEGGFRHQVSSLFDITATIIDAGEAKYPKEYDGHTITPLEGRSLLSVLGGKSLASRPFLYEHQGNAAIRDGNWKLVGKSVLGAQGLADKPNWKLFNIKEDRTEINDRSAEYPEKVEELEQLFLKEAKRTYILPRSN